MQAHWRCLIRVCCYPVEHTRVADPTVLMQDRKTASVLHARKARGDVKESMMIISDVIVATEQHQAGRVLATPYCVVHLTSS